MILSSQKIKSFISLNKKSFFRYSLVGLSGCILDVFTLFYLKEFLFFTPIKAVIINQFLVIVYVFTINKYWSFQKDRFFSKQIIRFLAVFTLNYFIAIFWMWLFNEKLLFNYLIVRLTNIALSVSWNFLLYKFFVYRD